MCVCVCVCVCVNRVNGAYYNHQTISFWYDDRISEKLTLLYIIDIHCVCVCVCVNIYMGHKLSNNTPQFFLSRPAALPRIRVQSD